METILTATEAREVFAEILNRAAFGGERFIIAKNGKNLAVILSLHEYEYMKQLETDSDLQREEAPGDMSKLKKFISRKRHHSP